MGVIDFIKATVKWGALTLLLLLSGSSLVAKERKGSGVILFRFTAEEIIEVASSEKSKVKLTTAELDSIIKIVAIWREPFQKVTKEVIESAIVDREAGYVVKPPDGALISKRFKVMEEFNKALQQLLGDERLWYLGITFFYHLNGEWPGG